MTQVEIDLLNQVQKEAIQNQTRFRSKYGSTPQLPRSPLGDIENKSVTSRRSAPPPPVVDPTPTKSVAGTEVSTTVDDASHDGTVEKDEINPKNVRDSMISLI